MTEGSFECLLYGKVAHTVKNIMKMNNWTEDYSFERFVDSEVYLLLEDEKTKVWHYSPVMLAILFNEERDGKIVWPDVI